MKRLLLAAILYTPLSGTESLAQVVDKAASSPRMTAVNILAVLFLCGLMGMVGQGCRVIVGFATIATSKAVAPAENQDVFNLARLAFSLLVGFVVGVVTALALWKQSKDGLAGIDINDFSTVLTFATAGYVGTDAIEAFTVQYFEQRKNDSFVQHEPL